jgi:RimJ/RimL family protein N-acetyltransferase
VIRLVDVYKEIKKSRLAVGFLYNLLKERDPVANISHREMPTFDQHTDFVDSLPYKAWYIVFSGDEPIGATYLTYENEIGISILKAYQGKHYGEMVVCLLMDMHPGKKFLANIAPGNAWSIAMFEGLGFKTIQLTLAKESAND